MSRKSTRPMCSATSKQTLKPCGNRAIPGLKTCKFHGGKTPSGPLSPLHKHGRYSKSLFGKMLAHYEEGNSDQDKVLEMTDELNLLDARVKQLVQEATTDGGTTFEEAAELLVDLYHAIQLEFPLDKILEAYNAVEVAIHNGWNREEIWDNILKALEHRRKIAEAEVKRLHASRTVVPVNQAREVIRQITDVFKRSVLAHADHPTANKILMDANVQAARIIS